MRSLVPLLCLASLACAPPVSAPDVAAARDQAMAQAIGQPSHAPATAEQWSASSASAEQSAREKESETIESPVRITGQGASAEHRFKVQGGRCYAAGLGWAFARELAVSVMFQARADGQPVNDSVGGARGRLTSQRGALTFCADRDGEAVLSVMSVKADGSAAMNELHEYALVLASRSEGEGASAQRRGIDSQRGASARANRDANIAEARAREAQALERRCRKCREDFTLCQVQNASARQNPRSSARITSCEHGFGVCATGMFSGTAKEMAQCGPPPG